MVLPDVVKQQSGEATLLKIAWPPVKRPKVGRPIRKEQHVKAIQRAFDDGKFLDDRSVAERCGASMVACWEVVDLV